MKIIGINYIYHDTSACVVSNGELLGAIEEERLSRQKHTQEFPEMAIERCLIDNGVSFESIDHIAVSYEPGAFTSEKLAYASQLGMLKQSFLDYEFNRLQNRELAFWAWYNRKFSALKKKPKVHFVNHHQSHGVGSYLVSGYNDAAILSVDGWGEWNTCWMGEVVGTNVKQLGYSTFPDSLGVFYSACTQFLGFLPNYDEGKTMGLAPTGNADIYVEKVRSLIKVDENTGKVQVDLKPFNFQTLDKNLFNEEFVRIFGEPRSSRSEFTQRHRDIAAAFQLVLEESLLKMCAVLRLKTKSRNLILAGGVALNSVANGRIRRESGFDNVYVMPGAGDNGTAIGAAYYVQDIVLQQRVGYVHDNPYLGTAYTNDEIASVLMGAKANFRRSSNVCAEAALSLSRGKIIGWFQGKMEFGARSLGNRSILADPSVLEMQAQINRDVKHRESFRPFAPCVPYGRVEEYFDLNCPSRFMQEVCDVKPAHRGKFPSITHVDGSARVQTVHKDTNAKFDELLERFSYTRGHPVLLNTSFNVMNEPVVESPDDALRCFYSCGLDTLVLGDYVLEKEPQDTLDKSFEKMINSLEINLPAKIESKAAKNSNYELPVT